MINVPGKTVILLIIVTTLAYAWSFTKLFAPHLHIAIDSNIVFVMGAAVIIYLTIVPDSISSAIDIRNIDIIPDITKAASIIICLCCSWCIEMLNSARVALIEKKYVKAVIQTFSDCHGIIPIIPISIYVAWISLQIGGVILFEMRF